MSETLQAVCGVLGIVGGLSGIVGAAIVYRGRRTDRDQPTRT